MKKIFLFVIATLFILSSCNQASNSPDDTQSPETVDTEAETIIYNVEEAGVKSDSIEELVKKLKDIKKGITPDIIGIADRDTLIIPDFSIEGYELRRATAEEYCTFYYYVPTEYKNIEPFNVDFTRDIVVTVYYRVFDEEDPLSSVIENYGKSPDEDGFIQVAVKFFFEHENTVVSFSFPDALCTGYVDLKSMCKVKTINID